MRTFELNGSWYYVVDAGRNPVTGKRVQKKKGGFKSEREAEKAARKLLVDLEGGNLALGSRMKFGELVEIFLNGYKADQSLKMTTINLKIMHMKYWLGHFDRIDVVKITRQMIQVVLNDMTKKYKLNTMNNMFASLKMVFNKAREMDIIKQSPCEFAYIPKKRKSLEEVETQPIANRFMEKSVLQSFLEHAQKYGRINDYPLFLMLAYTGLRIGEALALKWTDIDFDNQSISVTKTLYGNRVELKKFVLDTPKTDSSERVIAVDVKLLNELKQLRVKQKEFRLKHKSQKDIPDFNFVFMHFDENAGYPFTHHTASYRLKRLLQIAGIKQKFTPHSFRHTHTSLLAQAGVGLIEIMERLGHKDDKTTRQIYLHVTEELRMEAAQKFSRLMRDL